MKPHRKTRIDNLVALLTGKRLSVVDVQAHFKFTAVTARRLLAEGRLQDLVFVAQMNTAQAGSLRLYTSSPEMALADQPTRHEMVERPVRRGKPREVVAKALANRHPLEMAWRAS